MAEYIGYRCKQCGHKVTASPQGFGILRLSATLFFKCEKCQEIVTYSTTELGDRGRCLLTCPKCKAFHSLSTWNPIEGHSPKCDGEMEQDPDGPFILAD